MAEVIKDTTLLRIVDLETAREDWRGTFAEFARGNDADVTGEVRASLSEHGEAFFGGGAAPLVRIEIVRPRTVAEQLVAMTPQQDSPSLNDLAPAVQMLLVERELIRLDAPSAVAPHPAPWDLDHIRLTTRIVSRIHGALKTAAA